METIRGGEIMGSASSYDAPGEQKGEQKAKITARRRAMACSRRLWGKEDGFTLAGSRRA